MQPNPEEYRERTYRDLILNNNLIGCNVTVRETDLFILADSDLSSVALAAIHRFRSSIESYISGHREFQQSLTPVAYDKWAPEIIRDMMHASEKTGVGPMASVAGAIADHVGRELLRHAHNVIIENGGDIFLNSLTDLSVGLFAGRSPLSGHISIKLRKEEMPLGVCTSSGTVGHSLSFGCADACCVKSGSATLSDAAATAIGNIVKSEKDIEQALMTGMKIGGVSGILIIVGDRLGAVGDIELVEE